MVWMLLTACSEYDLREKDTDPFVPGGETGAPDTDTDQDTAPDTAETDPPDTAPPVDETCTVTLAAPRAETNPDCETTPEVIPPSDPWTLAVEWTWGDATQGLLSTPVVGDLDGDGTPEVVVVSGSDASYTTDLVVLDGATGAEEWSVPDGAYRAAGVALGDIDGDGSGDVVTWAGDYANAELAAYDATGALLWSTAVTPPFTRTYPSIVDLEGDGVVEILAGDQVFDGATGTVLVTLEISNATSASSIPVAADLDLDGVQEILYDTRVFDASGALLWQCALTSGYFLFPHPIDADGDPYGEVLVTTSGTMTLCDDDGTPLWEAADWGFPGAVGDFNGDGTQDFANNSYEGLSLHIAADGARAWRSRVTDVSGAAGSMSWDVDADGVPEVIAAGEQALAILDGRTGTIMAQYRHYSSTTYETPAVADVDGDGHGEILLPSNFVEPALTVLGGASGDWPPAAKVYNEYNFDGANVHEDLSIPAGRTPSWRTAAGIFRGQPSATLSETRPNATAAVTDVCAASCVAGAYAEVAVQVWNDGAAEMPAGTPVELWAEVGGTWTLLTSTTLAGALLAGASTELVFATTVDALGTRIEARVDGAGAVEECLADVTTPVESPCAR